MFLSGCGYVPPPLFCAPLRAAGVDGGVSVPRGHPRARPRPPRPRQGLGGLATPLPILRSTSLCPSPGSPLLVFPLEWSITSSHPAEIRVGGHRGAVSRPLPPSHHAPPLRYRAPTPVPMACTAPYGLRPLVPPPARPPPRGPVRVAGVGGGPRGARPPAGPVAAPRARAPATIRP